MFDVALQLFPSEAWRCALTSASRCVLTSASRCVLTSRHGMSAQGCVLKVCSRLLQPCSRYAQGMLKVCSKLCAKVVCPRLLKVCVPRLRAQVCSRYVCSRLCAQGFVPINGYVPSRHVYMPPSRGALHPPQRPTALQSYRSPLIANFRLIGVSD